MLGLLALAAVGVGAVRPALGQEAEPQPLRVIRVGFEGNERFSDAELAVRVRTRPNRRVLNVPGATWWLWVYRLGSSGALGRRLSEALTASGEPPALRDASLLAADLERLRAFYRQEGFREATVEARVDTVEGTKARVTFEIAPGPPTFLRQIRYEGVAGLDSLQRVRLARATILEAAPVVPAEPLVLRARGQRYSEPTLLEERRRLLAFLRDEGFAAISRDSIRAIVTPVSPDSYDVRFRIRPGPVHVFGDVHFAVTGPENGARPRFDTLAAPPVPPGWVTAAIVDERELEPALLARSMRFAPGDVYDQSALVATKRQLDATGLFAFTGIEAAGVDTLGPGPPSLAHRFALRTRRRHQVRVETTMLQRNGLFAEDELSTGLGFTYQNANLFGQGEAFELRTSGSIAADPANFARLDSTSAQAEVAASISYPYLVRPFRGLERSLGLYQARTRIGFSLLTARREELRLIIRGRGTARVRFEMQHRPSLTSFFDLIDVNLSNPDTLAGFGAILEEQLLSVVRDTVQIARIIEDYTVPQINTALRYTLRSARVNPLRRDRGYAYEGAVEVGSNLLWLLDRLVYSPGTVEGSLPGLPIFAGGREGNRLLYRQYVRGVADLRNYRPVGRATTLAAKLVVGGAHPTGRDDLVPFDRRFYSGGGTSVRGWDLRALGPGDTDFQTANILGGDLKLEASLEARTTFLPSLFSAEWMVVPFVDVGNVWLGPRNPGGPEGRFRADRFFRELGVGSGLGLRIAWDYLIVRLDLALRVHDPTERGVFPAWRDPDAANGPKLHFGIGHAF